MSSRKPDFYVVNTFYLAEGATRPVVHTFGPLTKLHAERMKKRLSESGRRPKGVIYHVTVNKMKAS